MRNPAASTQATFCATLVDEWRRCGVSDAVVAPGSRSTPLALALAAESGIEVHVHHDERSAGFMALGLGLASRRPAIVLTTSGTAAVELHPAVVEADLAGVPLIVATADRPPELHEVGAPQTVDQDRLYGRSVRWFHAPGVADAGQADGWRSLGSRSVAEATAGPCGPGPVHLNLAFREPLVAEPAAVVAGRSDGGPWHSVGGNRVALDRAGTARLAALLDARRGVIVAGAGAGEPDAVLALSAATGWPVLADPRSGCRLPVEGVISAFDAIVGHGPTAERLYPEVVLYLGDRPASKLLGRWLAGGEATEVAVHLHGRWFDPDHRAAHVLHADPTAVCTALARVVGGPDEIDQDWVQAWSQAEQAAQGAIDAVLAGHDEPTEPGVARAVVAALPDESTLMVSSSMPVRDVEWFGAARSPLTVLANRGANGIDGVLSTALGVALARRSEVGPTVALLGDVAFLHDTNALLGLVARPVDLTIVVIDNDGGGIFSFLPQAAALEPAAFEQLYATPHGVDLAALAAAHSVETAEPGDAAEVTAAVLAAVAAGGVRIIRVRTDRAANVEVHQELRDAVAANLTAG